jgi:hypothetical protein
MSSAAIGADSFLAFVNPKEAADIHIQKGWKPKVGQPLPQVPGVFIGKRFGAGALSMNSIFDLVDEQGKTVGQALKVSSQAWCLMLTSYKFKEAWCHVSLCCVHMCWVAALSTSVQHAWC